MRRIAGLLALVALLCAGGLANAAPVSQSPATLPAPAPTPGACKDGTLPGGALSRICVPASGWNGDLLIYAHGYVAPGDPLAIQDPTLQGLTLSTTVQGLGYAFATTSYRRNGLAVLEGAQDIRELAAAFPAVAGKPAGHTYLLGFSEGGLIATLLVEQSRTLFSGALAGCGPVGDFQRQIEYFGDFRVLFDYFFPGVIPPDPANIPQNVIDNWLGTYAPAVGAAVATNPISATQLISTSMAPVDPAKLATTIFSTTQDVLWYNIFSTNDARAQLGGNPYGNVGRTYSGSKDDAKLNAAVQRITADPAALAKLAAYQTTGRPQVPLVLLHTTGDDVVPFWHEALYAAKAQSPFSRNVTQIPVSRYGHCTFTSNEILGAFNTLVQQATTPRPQLFLPIAGR